MSIWQDIVDSLTTGGLIDPYGDVATHGGGLQGLMDTGQQVSNEAQITDSVKDV